MLRLPLAAALTILAGCVGVSRREGADRVQTLLNERVPSAVQWRTDPEGAVAIDARVAELTAAKITPATAFQVAQLRNPRMAAEYARLGLAQADVVEASRIGNPTFSGSALKDGGPSKIATGLTAPLADLLLLPARRRLAAGEYERAQQTIAADLVNLAADVEVQWYEAAGAEQVALMREAVATAAATSAELAQRFFDAGNISALELKLEQAAASQARIAALSARANATRERLALNTHMGLSGAQAAQWQMDVPLAAPVPAEDGLETLRSLAFEQRLDLAAARREVELLGSALGLARRWRLLGAVDVGVEREKETDGSKLTGPTLSLAIPLFNQGQAAIARAQAQWELAKSALAQRELEIDNDVRLGMEGVNAQRGIVEQYRTALVPQREAVVARQVERLNYMLIGAFELLLAKQQEYDAYQGYLEAVRDYWVARVELGRAIGARLPSAATVNARTIGVDAILTPSAPNGAGHGGHGGQGAAMPGMNHGGHDMSSMKPAPTPSPTAGSVRDDGMQGMDHAGHDMSSMKPAPTPSPTQSPARDDGMQGMDHTGHDMSSMKPASDPVNAASPRDDGTQDMDHAGHDMPMKATPPPARDAPPKKHSRGSNAAKKPTSPPATERPKDDDGMPGMDHGQDNATPTPAPAREDDRRTSSSPGPSSTARTIGHTALLGAVTVSLTVPSFGDHP